MFAQVIEARKRALVAYNPKQLYRLYRDYARLADGISGTATTDNGGARLRQYLQTRLQARIDPGEGG